MKRKSIKIMTTTLLLSTMLSFSSLAAWEQSEAGWKYKDDNTQQYVTARWIESVSEAGLWYYIKDDGIMATNAWIDDVYYVNEAGEWREGQTDGNNQGDIDSWKGYTDLDDWDQGGGVNLDQDLLDRMEEGLNKVR